MGADLKFYDLTIGESVQLGEVLIENALLNHPGEAVGYRVSWRGGAVAYITDTEHFPDRLDNNVLWLARNADLLIYDATYTDEEYYSEQMSRIGWGHSTWQEAVKVAKAANVKQLVIFHHDPLHDDAFMDQVRARTADQFPNSLVAWEGLEIAIASRAVAGSLGASLGIETQISA